MTSPVQLHGKCDPRFTAVRHTRAFSKKVENHSGAIRYFICYYNLTRTALFV
jgi:hypothetical protein